MAYIALYRKYRPQTFTDVVGQHQVSDTLMRAIREDKVAHAYLFAGPRGTGKTSMAKIFARAINCEYGDVYKRQHIRLVFLATQSAVKRNGNDY